MIAVRFPVWLGVAALLVTLSACGGAPYVYNTDEFNRDSDFYLKGLDRRDTVGVCYSKRRTTPGAVSALAVAECRRFGKVAVFTSTSYNLCPLTTPVAAIYDCVAASKAGGKVGS